MTQQGTQELNRGGAVGADLPPTALSGSPKGPSPSSYTLLKCAIAGQAQCYASNLQTAC